MNSLWTVFLTVALFAGVSAAQTPAAGAVTAIDAGARLTDDAGVTLTPTVGVNAHEGFCGLFARQAETTAGLVSSVATAVDLIDDLTPSTPASRAQWFYELAPIIDLVNASGSNGVHTPNVSMPWQSSCTSNGGSQGGGEKMAFRFRGNLHITSAGTKTFLITSDDGYSLRIGGVTVMELNGNRSVSTDTRRVSFAQPGVYPVELIYWDQGGNAVLEAYFGDGNYGLCSGGTNVDKAGASGSGCGGSGNTYADRSSGTVPTAANLAANGSNFQLLSSALVGLPTWSNAQGDQGACNARVGQPSTICVASTGGCGNGVVDAIGLTDGGTSAEQCDDGNTTNGDGCSATCTTETNFVCTAPQVSVCTRTPPVITSPTTGAYTNVTTPVISGTGIAGATVTVKEGATTLCTATVAAGGAWSCTSSALTANAAHTVTATQTSGGYTSNDSNAVVINVDTTAPAKPVVAAPTGTVATATPTVSGTAEANSTVRVYLDGGATPVCTTTASSGGAWSCTSTTLADGLRSATATATDAAGNVSAVSTARTFTVDTTTTVAFTAPVSGATVASATPTLSGTGENGATVVVKEGATTRCSATVSGGVWSCVSSSMTDGAHSLTATATDAVGNTASASRSFSTDTVTTVSITAPAAGVTLATATPTLSGTGENGATVVVKEGATTLCTATVAAGAWSCISSTLTDGAHAVTATATDLAGNTASANRSFGTDTVTTVAISAPAAGGTVATTTPTIAGTGENGATVVVREGATVRCSATVAGGVWSCASSAVTDGAHTFSATATDALGNTATAGVSFTTDTVTTVAFTAPAAGATVGSATPTLSGTGENGATVVVKEGATTLCSATVAAGTWSCTSSTLTDGAHTVTATATDLVGNTASANRTFTTDTVTTVAITAPAANAFVNTATPSVSGTGETGATVVVKEGATTLCTATVAAGAWSCASSTLADGAHTVTATATDLAGNTATANVSFTVDTAAPSLAITAPVDGAVLTTATVTLTGTVSEVATVSVGVTGNSSSVQCLAATQVTTGTWTCTISLTGNGETFTISAHAVDRAGNSADTTSTFTLDNTTPVAPLITSAPAALSNDTTPTFSGTAEANSTVAVTITGGASQHACTATADASGAWSCTATLPVSAGGYSATATATDAAGNTSAASSPAVSFVIDVTTAVTFDAPVDGTLSNDPNLALSGTAESGAEVVLTDATLGELCRVTVPASGAWSCAPTLGDATYAVTAVTTDLAGNTASAGPVGFTIDSATFVTLTSPADGASIADAGVTFGGAGEPLAMVDVTQTDGGAVCVTTVQADGGWSCGATLADGTYFVSAAAHDPASNVAVSSVVSFTIDTTPPTVPAFTSPDAGATVTTASPTLGGTGEAGSSVSVYEGATLVCTATVDSNGTWSCTPTTALVDGDHTFVARASDTLGNTSADSAALTITVDTLAPAIALTAPMQGATVTTATPVISGTGEDGSTVTVSENGSTVCTATVSAGTWSCTAPTLSQGAHAVTAVAVDGAGNASPATAARDFFIDSIAPNAPVIAAPTANQLFSTSSVVISGTAEAGSTVNVSVDGAQRCTVTADATTGAWSCAAATFTDGPHSASATATDAAGNVSAASTATPFTVDTTAPAAVVIVAPANDAVVKTSPTISGTAEAGATVTLYAGNYPTPLCTTTADASGAWSCATSLTDGAYLVTAIATDAAGHQSAPSTVRFTVDSSAPTAPTILAPAEGATTSSATTFSGTAEPLATVHVKLDGSSTDACTATVSAAGTWSCVATGLMDGAHTALATAVDAAGNTSADSSARHFTVSADVPPGPPVITAPAEGSRIADTTPTISGVAAPGSTVRVYADGSSTPVCTATAAADGRFSCDIATTLADGAHTVTAAATVSGQTSMPSQPVHFNVDTTPPGAPVITRPVSGDTTSATPVISGTAEAGSTVSVYVDGASTAACTATTNAAGVWACSVSTALTDGAHTVNADATDAAGNTSARSSDVGFNVVTGTPVGTPVILTPADSAVLASTSASVSGVAEPFSVVTVSLDGATLCSVLTGATGEFVCTASGLSEGAHAVNATATLNGNTSAASTTVHFSVDTQAPDAPTITSPDANAQTGRTPAISGVAQPGVTVEVRVDGQVMCTAIADTAGAWSCTPSQPLPPGAHAATAVALDAAGNRSATSTAVPFTVLDTPVTPVITAPTAANPVTDTTPTVSGTGEPGSTITVTLDGATYCTATADQSGAWSCEGTTELTTGQHTVVATSTTAGGTSTSTPVTFSVNDLPPTPPAAPVITAPSEGASSFDTTPTFSGTAEAGTTISVKVDGVEVCTAVADATGHWSCTPGSALTDGAHIVTATATLNGVTSDASTPVHFSTSSTRPTLTSPSSGGITGTTATLTGTAPAGSTVTVTANGEPVCTATADATGHWSCDASLPVGDTTLVVTVSDADGNTLTSDPVTVHVVLGRVGGGGLGCSSTPAGGSLWLAVLALVGFLFRKSGKTAKRVVAGGLLASTLASAQVTVAPFDLEKVRLNPGAADGLLQEGGKLMDPMTLRVSLLGHYENTPLVIRDDAGKVTPLVQGRVTAHLAAAFGITDWLEAGLQLPVVLAQPKGTDSTGYAQVATGAAMGTPWLQLRAAPLRESAGQPLDLSIGLAVGFPLGSKAALSRDNTVTAVPTIGIGHSLTKFLRLGGNISVNLRPATSLADGSTTTVGSYATIGAVLSTTEWNKFRFELSGRADIPFTVSAAGGEVYLGARYAPIPQLELMLIGGPGFGQMPGTPSFRVLAGLAYVQNFKAPPAPVALAPKCVQGEAHDVKACPELDLDGDGVKNADDRCADVLGLVENHGCPDQDSDGDGVLDLADKCVKVPGVRALDGCPEPDADQDGVADARDACPNVAGPAASDGCPDTDGDGFHDGVDACVNELGVAALKGCPDADSDGDGVVDRLDNCPKEKGTSENQGCPAKKKQLVIITEEKLLILDKVYFASGKAAVLARSQPLMAQLAQVLNDHPNVKHIVIEGHTDNVGKPEKNLVLSQQRAEAVMAGLVKLGVDGARLQAKGYGDTKPIAENTTAKGKEQNRRVEFTIVNE